MIFEILKYIIFIIVVIWICFEIFYVVKIVKRPLDKLIKGKTLFVEKTASKNAATLKIISVAEENNQLKIEASFFTNFRWWRQKIPKVGEDVYFYLLKENFNKDQYNTAYGINTAIPCSKAKLIADLYYYYGINYMYNFSYLLMGLFLIYFLGKPAPDAISIFSGSYLLVRMVLKSFMF